MRLHNARCCHATGRTARCMSRYVIRCPGDPWAGHGDAAESPLPLPRDLVYDIVYTPPPPGGDTHPCSKREWRGRVVAAVVGGTLPLRWRRGEGGNVPAVARRRRLAQRRGGCDDECGDGDRVRTIVLVWKL